MKLAEEIIILIGAEEVELRPSLRHAIQLERRPGSFRQLILEIQEGSLSAAVEVIEPHHLGPHILNQVFDVLPVITPALLRYVFACAGIDDRQPANENRPVTAGRSVPFNVHLESLYKLGTGWLGWTPENTLDATPAEIQLAYEGRLDMLKAIFGSSEKAASADTRPLNEKFKTIFAGFGTHKGATS